MIKKIPEKIAKILLALTPRLLFPSLNSFLFRMMGYNVSNLSRVCSSVKISGNINVSIGKNTFIGDYCYLTGGLGNIVIGENCDISDKTIICTGTHEIGLPYRRAGEGIGKDVNIGNGVWIGIGSIILPGTKIGNGSIIGAGSVVNKDIPEDVIAAGNPCKVIKKIYEKN